MISSPSNSTQFNTIRRTQSTDVEFPLIDNHRRNIDLFPLHDKSNRLDIFRRPHMSPIGTRTKTIEVPDIRPSLSCPAAVFESPLRNLLPPREEPIEHNMDVLEVSAIEFDDPSIILPEENEEGSDVSFPRNLNSAFDLMVPSSSNGPSSSSSSLAPTPVLIPLENISVPYIPLPAFSLSPSLTVSLSPGLLSRVSIYSLIRDINAEASICAVTDPKGREVMGNDGKIHVHPTAATDHSILFTEEYNFSNSLLDEEWFLLSAIVSRSTEEVESSSELVLPTFAEAMGEVTSEGTGSSKTQLWKPGRSWWEAKSGKNPWVEPVVHNNRWRYLWPLIHYHKFIAKCIKKLKRNGIDVRTSTSTLSIFLRQEVCHVSDHLAFMSKYDSEEWTEALRNFDGWTDHDPAAEETVRKLVLCQRLVSGSDDVDSSLLRSQLDETVLKAMAAVKQEAAKAAASENYDYAKGHGGGQGGLAVQIRNDEDSASQSSFFHSGNRSINRSWSGSTGNPQSATKTKKLRGYYDGNWREEYPPSYHNPAMYGPQYGHPPHYSHPYGATIEPQFYHQYEQYHPPHHPHNMMGYHHGGDMPYHPSYYNGYYDGSFHEGIILDNSMQSDSYVHPSAMASPNRYHADHPQYPMSPYHQDYWGHLNISQLPGIAPSPNMSMHTPSKPPRGNPNRSFRKRQQGGGKNPPIDGNAKSLIIFPKQANSPASRFVMSPQDKSNPYYSARNFQSSSVNQSTQEESFVLPAIEDFAYTESRNDKVEGQSTKD